MKTSILAAFLCLGALASSAFAADFAVKGNINETLVGSDNEFLNNNPKGPTGESTTAGTLDFLAQTPTTRYLLDTHASYFNYFGPGAADTTLTWGTPASARFTIDHTTMLTNFNVGASWSRADVAQTQLQQSGVATGRGSVDTYNVFGGITHDLSRIDTLTWSAKGSTVSFTDPTSTPYTDINSAIVWTHLLGQTTTWYNSLSFDGFSQDNPAKSQRLFWTARSGLRSQLSPRLSVNADVYLAFVNSYQRATAFLNVPSTSFQPQVGAGHSVFGDVGLNYRVTKTTSLSLVAADTVVPVLSGQLQQSKTVGLSVSHQINEVSKVAFFTRFAQIQTPVQIGQTSTASDFLSAGATYGYRLTREWYSSISYSYAQREDQTGTARSNTILFVLSRDFNVFGNPAPINEAAKARALERAQQAVGFALPFYH